MSLQIAGRRVAGRSMIEELRRIDLFEGLADDELEPRAAVT